MTFSRPGSSSEEKTPACQQVGSAAAVLHLLQLQKAHHCLGSEYPPKYATSRWCLAPHPFFLTVPSPVSSPQTMGLLAGEAGEDWTSFQCNFLGEQTALDLVSLLVGCQEGQLPSNIFLVETIAVRHRNMLKLTSNSLCVLLQMNRQKTSWAERGALLHQSLDFSLSSKQRIQTPTMSSLLQTKNIYNLSKPGSGRAIQTVSSTS